MSHRSKASKRQPRETKGPEVAAASNRGDDISEPMEEGSCFGAHAPLRLKDDGLVRHPGLAAESLGPLVAALMSRI